MKNFVISILTLLFILNFIYAEESILTNTNIDEKNKESSIKQFSVPQIFPETTGLILIPTAYRNPQIKSSNGINVDGIFATFIGSLWNRFREENALMQQIFFVLVGGDIKWNFLKEEKYYPALAIGSSVFGNLQGSSGGIVNKAGKPFSYLYGIMSKKWNKNAFHFGLMYSPEVINSEKKRWIFLGGTEIWNLVSTKSLANATKKVRSILADTNYTIISGFNTNIFNKEFKIEFIYPLVNKEKINAKKEITENKTIGLPDDQDYVFFNEKELDLWLNDKYYLINCYVKSFPFQFSYLKIPEGFSIIGSFYFRFNIFPLKQKEIK